MKIVNKSDNPLPTYATDGSAGMDLRSNENAVIQPRERLLIKTGLSIQLPRHHEAQIRSRSGLAHKYGIVVLNSPGTIDSDYTGEIGVLLYNSSDTTFSILKGDRIAQMVISEYEKANWLEVDNLNETERGSGGFGSTGTK